MRPWSETTYPALQIRRVEAGRPPLAAEPWPRRVHRGWPWALVRVYVAEQAMEHVWRSVGRCPECGRVSAWAAKERGGALAGRYAQNGLGRRFIVITDAIPAPAAASSRARIDIRAEDWKTIHRRIAALPGRRLLGWYHSQPGLGVRMSPLDLETQRCLFAADWQIGLVVDPLRGAFRFYSGAAARRVNWLAFTHGRPEGRGGAAAPGASSGPAPSAPGCRQCGGEP
jgi:proteasome lid subunit RPN8/RPN11